MGGNRATASDECAAIERRLTNSARTGSDCDDEHVYWHVALSLRRWINRSEDMSTLTVERCLRRSIRHDLRRTGHRSAAESITRRKETDYCDIVVNRRIGLKILHNPTRRSREWMHKQLRSLLREYDYLILYGHRISSDTIDVWRQLKRSLVRASGDEPRFHAVGTIQRDHHRPATEPAASGTSRWPFAVGLAATVVASTAAFVAVGGVETVSTMALIVLGSAIALLLWALLASHRGERLS